MKSIRKLMVEQMLKELGDVQAGVFINYQGLTSEEVNALRRFLEERHLRMRVYKNTLLRIVFKEKGIHLNGEPFVEEIFSQPTAVIFSKEAPDPVDASKAIHDWKKETEKKDLPIKGGFFKDRLLSEEEVKKYAALPSREMLIAQVVGAIAAPLRSFLSVLQAPMRDFVLTLKAIQEQKEKE